MSYPSFRTLVALLLFVCYSKSSDGPTRASPTPPTAAETFLPGDRLLLHAIGEGRLAEARELVEARLVEGASCATYELAVEAARRGGWLDAFLEDLIDRSRHPPFAPAHLYGLGSALVELGEDQRARNVFAAAVAEGSPCLGAYRGFLHESGKSRRLREAISVLSRLARSGRGSSNLLVALGLAQESLGEGRLARKEYERAVVEAPPTPSAHWYLASLLAKMGRFASALQAAELGLRLGSEDPEDGIQLLKVRNVALLMLGRRAEAMEGLDRALQIAKDSRVNALYAGVLLDGADLAGAAGEGDRFTAFFDRATEVDDSTWSPRGRAAFLLRVGSFALGTGDVPFSSLALSRAQALLQKVNEPYLEADLRLQLVHLRMMTGEPTRALEEGAFVLARAIELEDGERQAESFAALGSVYDRLGRFRDALESYRRALRFEERTGDRHRQSLALGNLALVYLRMGLPGPALVHAQQALELGRVIPDARLQASLQQALASALAGAGNYAQSDRVFAQAVRTSEGLPSRGLRGIVLSGRGRVLLALGRLDEAQAHFEQALALARRTDDSFLRLQSRSGLALVAWRQGRLEAALRHLEESEGLVEGSRNRLLSEGDRISYDETRSQIYGNLASVLLELDAAHPGQGYDRRAFRTVERARARALLDLLDVSAAPVRSPVDRGEGAVSTLAELERTLRPEELLVLFELGESRSVLWTLSRRGLAWHELPPRSVVERHAEAFLDAIRMPPRAPENPPERHREEARALYEMLLGPIDSDLRSIRRLVISPDSELYRLPFEALLAREPGGEERYLVENHSISYTPSASVLANLRRRSRSSGGALFLGVAQPGGNELLSRAATIPHAVSEVEGVGALFPEGERLLLLGADAEEAALKAAIRDFRMIHIAAHGLADERYPLRSALFLGTRDPEREDGVLRMAEVLDLKLSSDLVVLSACETGRGRLLRAEGALGFSWAFLTAGASTAAVSLWNVNDRATSELMGSFYQGVVAGDDLADAMAEAKRAMLRSNRPALRHPYYWAPFVLMGRGDGVDLSS